MVNVNNLFELTFNSLTGFITIGLLLFSFFYLSDKIISSAISLGQSVRQLVIGFLISAPIFTVICFITNNDEPIVIFWVFVTVIIIGLFRIRQKKDYAFSQIILLIVIFSIFGTYILSKSNNIKERDHRKLLAERLVIEQDPVAEYLFGGLEKEMAKDSIITVYLTGLPETKETLSKYISDKYFTGFWEKYDAQITICEPMDSLLIEQENIISECCFLFNGMISKQGIPTLSSNFYFLNNDKIGRAHV